MKTESAMKGEPWTSRETDRLRRLGRRMPAALTVGFLILAATAIALMIMRLHGRAGAARTGAIDGTGEPRAPTTTPPRVTGSPPAQATSPPTTIDDIRRPLDTRGPKSKKSKISAKHKVITFHETDDEAPPSKVTPTHDSDGPIAARPAAAAAPDFDEIERGFRTAQAAYVIPETMLAGESSHVHLDLSFQRSLASLQTELEAHVPGQAIATVSLRTSSIAQARLTGQQFQITAVTSEEQPVGSKTTTWEWEVVPKSGGRYPLHLSVDAVVRIGPDARRWTINTFERSVQVRVSMSARIAAFAGANWKWLWTTVAAPIAGWMWVRRRKRPSEKLA